MTAPNHEIPDQANQFGDVIPNMRDIDPAIAAQASNLGLWQTAEGARGHFHGGILGGFLNIMQALGSFGGDLLQALLGNLIGHGGFLGGISSWSKGQQDAIAYAQETAMTGVDEAAAAAARAAANEEANIANSTAIAEANLAIGTKAGIEDIPTDVPLHMSLNPVDDAVFPFSDMKPIPVGVTGSTEVNSGDSGHFHNLVPGEARVVMAEPVYTTAINRLDIGYINATRDRIYNTVGFTIAEQNQPTKATVRVGIYKMSKTDTGLPNGNLTLIWISPLSASIQSQFGLAAQDIKIDLGVDIIATKGDIFAVCVVQTGGANTQRHLLGMQTARKNAISGVFPTRLAMTRAGETAPPNTLTPAQLDNTSTWVPWMFLGQSLGLIKMNFIDLFDRSNSGALGPNWATYGAGMDIVNGVARCKRINRGNLTSRVEDRSQGVYVSQLATDTMAASGKIDAFDRSHADLEENPRAQVAVRVNADMTRFVSATVRFGMIEIRAYSSANPAGVTKNSTARTWSSGDVLELRATDDVGTGRTDFTAYVNGSPVLSWTDAGNEASKGPAFRRAGFETASTHRGAVFGYLSIPSVGIDEWKAKDL